MHEDLTALLWRTLDEIVLIVAAPSRRAFWPFLISSLIIGTVVMCFRTGSFRDGIEKIRAAFGLRVWLHRSSLVDLRLIVVNTLLRVFAFPAITLSAMVLTLVVVALLTLLFGETTAPTWPRWMISSTYTIALFVVWDFSRWLLHMIAHEVDLLWEFHKIHHSAEVLTPLSIYRAHPIEVYLFTLRGAIATGLVTGLFSYVFRGTALQYEFLGVNAVGWAFNAAGANLRHTNVWFPYPRIVEYVLMSPAQHQIHHGNKHAEYRANYGAFLSVWDWLYGSLFLASDHREPLVFGLTVEDNNHHPTNAWSSIVGPFAALARRFRSR